jgi:hypothetical protein
MKSLGLEVPSIGVETLAPFQEFVWNGHSQTLLHEMLVSTLVEPPISQPALTSLVGAFLKIPVHVHTTLLASKHYILVARAVRPFFIVF